jgi:hypothetical protein
LGRVLLQYADKEGANSNVLHISDIERRSEDVCHALWVLSSMTIDIIFLFLFCIELSKLWYMNLSRGSVLRGLFAFCGFTVSVWCNLFLPGSNGEWVSFSCSCSTNVIYYYSVLFPLYLAVVQ